MKKFILSVVICVLLNQQNVLAQVGESTMITYWNINNVESIEGHNTTILSEPQVVESPKGFAVQFDGIDDGLLVDSNPMEGASSEFTIEVIFKPYASYPDNVAQRFIHFQNPDNENRRILIELRLTVDNQWYLDTFIKSENSSLALMDEGARHPVDEWYHAALVYKNGLMKHYVNRVEELSGNVSFLPIEGAKTSIGTRMDQRSWFKGAIQTLKVTHRALTPEEFINAEVEEPQTYIPPIGIPAPEFGIEESHMMYAGELYDFGNGPEPYKDAGNGPYTHYVDKTHPSATDNDNIFGTPSVPRLTIPYGLSEGSVVEVHNGPYNYTENVHNGSYLPLIDYYGTQYKPIFIRGAGSEYKFEFGLMGGKNQILVRNASYVILENVLIDGPGIKFYQPTDHFSIRNSEITGENSSGIDIWTYKNDFVAGELKQDIVIYNNLIHDNGPYPSSTETGKHAIMIDDASKNIWVLDNQIYNNGDDGIHILDREWVPNIGPNADRVFIGRNIFHHDGENAIDVKGSSNIIISQNEIYGYATIMNSSHGEAIRINDEGAQENIWILYNTIYDSEQAINPAQCLSPPYIIGNIIYDCDIAIRDDAESVVNNVIYNCGTGIAYAKGEVANNIIMNVTGDPFKNDPMDSKNNLLWNNGLPEICTDCIEADPLFIDADNGNFRLNEASPAIDAGRTNSAYYIFNDLYGIDIKYDLAGNIRPQGENWDIGAFEESSGTYPIQYNLEINTNGYGSVSPNGGNFIEGDIVEVTAIPDAGSEFTGWSGDFESLDNPAQITMDSDKSITATFEGNAIYSLNVNTSGSGNVMPVDGSYEEGSIVTLVAVPDSGWQFDTWSGDLISAMSPAAIVIDGDKAITANFVVEESSVENLPVASVTASTFEAPNAPENTLDNDLSTRWSAEGEQWIKYILDDDITITNMAIAWHSGGSRISYFDVHISVDDENWQEVFSGQSAGQSSNLAMVHFSNTPGRYVRITGYGNSSNNWNSILEVDIYGYDSATGLEDDAESNLPENYSLKSYPNPFNPSTTIEFGLPTEGRIQMEIYDITGRKVTDLIDDVKPAGYYNLKWNADGENGLPVATGIYLLSMRSGNFNQTIKLMCLR